MKQVSITQKYLVGSTWNTLTSSVSVSRMDGVRLTTTSSKPYILKYRTYNRGSGWLPYVTSLQDDYAGLPNKAIEAIDIRVYDKNGNKLDSKYVVMYRAYLGGKWLSWVSNATPTIMNSIKNEFNLSGTLDTSSWNAGIEGGGSNITKLEIRVFEPDSTTTTLTEAEICKKAGNIGIFTGCSFTFSKYGYSLPIPLSNPHLSMNVAVHASAVIKSGTGVTLGINPTSSSPVSISNAITAKAASAGLSLSFKNADLQGLLLQTGTSSPIGNTTIKVNILKMANGTTGGTTEIILQNQIKIPNTNVSVFQVLTITFKNTGLPSAQYALAPITYTQKDKVFVLRCTLALAALATFGIAGAGSFAYVSGFANNLTLAGA